MQEDKHEIAMRLYESTAEIYKFSFKTSIQLIAGYLAGSGLLFAFYVAHPDQKILLLLPVIAGVGLFIICLIAALFTKNLDEMFSGPLETLKHAVNHPAGFEYMFPAHQPLTYLLLVFALMVLYVAGQCLFIGDFIPKSFDPLTLGIVVGIATALLAYVVLKLIQKIRESST